MNLYDAFALKLPGIAMKREEPLSMHTSFHIGGPAELMAFPATEGELSQLLRAAAELGARPMLLGAGTNVLAPDEGLRGLVIVTRDCLTGLERRGENQIAAMAGVSMAKLALFAMDASLTGLEFAHGIPGTVGGGVYMNAGAYGGEIRQTAVETRIMRLNGETETVSGDAQGFSYRSSAFQKQACVILRTVFALKPGDRKEIHARMQELAEKRRASQPLELPSAGSAFKRPVGGYAAALIEQAGLKGFRVGGAAVSEKHAGFIVNCGAATAADVLRLIEVVQQRVLKTSGILLEPEIRLWRN